MMPCQTRRLGLLISCFLVIGAVSGGLSSRAAFAQQRVTTKSSGMTFQSGERAEEIVTALVEFATPAPGEVQNKPILMIPDGLRRVFIAKNNVATIADMAPAAFERFVIPQNIPSGDPLANTGPVIARGAFDEFGRRTFRMASGSGPADLIQGVTEINPRYVKVEAIKLIERGKDKLVMSDMRFRTNSISAVELRAMIYRTIDMNDAQQRLRVYKLFVQAERYGDAAEELDSIIRQFPDLTELKDQRKSLLQIGAQEFIREIDRRANAGQHKLAIFKLETFPQEEVASETLIQVRDKLKTYEDTLKQRDGIIAALDRDLGEISDPELKKGVEEVLAEIKDKMKISTLPRLADYDRLKDDKSLPADQRYALAVGGWVLGQGFTKARTLSVALSAYETRKLVWRYMKTSREEAPERAAILKLISEQEAGAPEFLARIVLNMLPFGDIPTPPTGAPEGFFELKCRGAAETSPPVTYYVQLPPEYDPQRYYPTLVALHGQNAPAQAQIDWWCGPVLPDGSRPGQASRHGYIVIAPAWSMTGAGSYRFSADEHSAVLNSLRDATKRFSVDTDRVFLTGLAAGADAAWDIGLSHPDLWAGVLPVSPQVDKGKDTDRYIDRYADNARGLPFYFVFGEKDGSPLASRFGKLAEEYLKGRGYDCTFVEYQGRGLEDYFEEVIEMFRWMELYRRDFRRKEFEGFTSMRPTDNFAWCLEIDAFAPRWIVQPLAWPPPKNYRSAKSSVKIVDNGKLNVIHLNCDGEQATLWLSPDFVDFEKPIQINRSSKTQVKQKPDAETLLEDVRTRGDRQHPFWMRVTL